MNDLPTRRPNDPPIPGPHRIVGEPGITEHLVFAGPNTWPRQPPWKRRALRLLDWLLLPIGLVAGAMLALAWNSLDTRARLTVTAVALCAAAGHWTIHRTRRRKVRS